MPNYDKNEPLGSRNDDDITAYLLSIGDKKEARYFVQDAGGQSASFLSRPYKSTGIVLGFIPSGSTAKQVTSISAVAADRPLIGQRIKITLDKFFVAKYPGFGTHSILCEFSGKNQVPGETEELSFAMRFEARDDSGPAIAGAPIFMGLTVAPDGISFKGKTVNVKNSGDDMVMAVRDVRSAMALGDLQIDQQRGHRLGAHAGAAIGVQRPRARQTAQANGSRPRSCWTKAARPLMFFLKSIASRCSPTERLSFSRNTARLPTRR